MLLIALTSRLCDRSTESRTAALASPESSSRAALRNLFDLSVAPARRRDFAARCVLLVVCALTFYSLGAGAALFIQRVPLFALIVFGALLGCGIALINSRD